METQNNSLDADHEFAKVINLLVEYLKKNHHPHVTVIVTQNGGELLEGIKYHPVTERPSED